MTYHTDLQIDYSQTKVYQKQSLKNQITATVNDFEGIALENLGQVKLLNRVDTKFTFGLEKLDGILRKLQKDYFILDINNNRVMDYESLYYDSSDLAFYLAHHNERTNRLKVRYRRYVVSDICFFELKFKNNKGKKTIKTLFKLISKKPNKFLSKRKFNKKEN